MNKILDLDSDFDKAVSEAAETLNDGKLVLLPTDTVYGLAAIPTDRSAVEEIFQRKKRLSDQACAVLISEIHEVFDLAVPSSELELLSQNFWPGPMTIVGKRAQNLNYFLGGDESSIGVRCPDHTFMRSLTAITGPLAVTSANLSGLQTPENAKEAVSELGENLLVVDGGPCKGKPSTVLSLLGESLDMLREGTIGVVDLVAAVLRV
mgnify:CR=1 FL=1